MKWIIDISLLVFLLLVVFQDLKQRQISWFLIPLLLAAFIYKAVDTNAQTILLKDVLWNIVFIMIQLVLLTLYLSIKNKKMVNIVNTYIGLGDLLFFIVVCAAFSPANFIVFYLLSLFFTLTGVVVYNLVSKKQVREIPLAGAMAMVLIVLIIANKIVPAINFYNDGYLLNIMSAL